MGSRACHIKKVKHAARALVLCFASLAIVLGINFGAAHAGSANSPNTLTDAQLAQKIEQLNLESEAIGRQLLEADTARNLIVDDRDRAQNVLSSFLAQEYKQASARGSVTRQMLISASLEEIVDRLKVVDAVGSYHQGVIRSLNETESKLAASHSERMQRIDLLGKLQDQLVPLQAEQGRRYAQRAEWQAKRDAAKRRAQARRDQAARDAQSEVDAGLLVGNTSAAVAQGSIQGFAAAGSMPSAALIDAYLASKGSPMTGQGAAFMASGIRWQVDPRLLVAIAGAESSFGQITCGPNNAWGWACPNDPADFATWAAGIDTVTRGLRRYYLDEGRTSVALIQQKYCPVGAANDPTGLNSHWVGNVTKFLLELGGNPSMVGPGPGSAGALQLPGIGIVAVD